MQPRPMPAGSRMGGPLPGSEGGCPPVADALGALTPARGRVAKSILGSEEARILPVVLRLGNLSLDRVGLEATVFIEPFGQLHGAIHSTDCSPPRIRVSTDTDTDSPVRSGWLISQLP